EAAVTAALGPETLADADTGAAPPAMKPAPATARPVQAGSAEAAPSLVEKPASQAMLPSYRAEAPSNVVSTPAGGAEPMAPVRPARATARSPEPTLPVVRQELPESAGATESRVAPAPSRPRERREPSSDSPASVSGLGSTPAERIASRGDADTVGAKREARNLPQPDGGSERPAGSADRVTLQVSDGEGRQTRIRVSVVGDQVRAVITPPDNESARQLEHRMDELQTALARQGFTASRVSVQAAGESGSEGAVAAAVTASTSDVRTTPGREQPAGDQRQGRGQRDQQPPGGGHRQQQGRSRDQGTEQRRRQP
ncbi:MAG TPA: flagellar hook-length control protein FliK, partial [Gemmatimonadales bacterium]|nr:flagellar hook-length control protein FliK [Gemmatimonadales bacterium]